MGNKESTWSGLIEADIHEYVGMSYVDKNILGPLVHMCVYPSVSVSRPG